MGGRFDTTKVALSCGKLTTGMDNGSRSVRGSFPSSIMLEQIFSGKGLARSEERLFIVPSMADRPPVLYKYLDSAGARVFLNEPQMRWKDFRQLDDLMEILPGIRPLTEAEVRSIAKIQAAKTGITAEKCAHYYRTLSGMDPTYWERNLRELIDEQEPTMFICSMSVRANSGAMWGLYAERHQGIVFGVGQVLEQICAHEMVLTREVLYDEIRPQLAIPVVDKKVILEAVRTKSRDWKYQDEWRLISTEVQNWPLHREEVAEIVVGYKAPADILKLALAFKANGTQVFQAYPDPEKHLMALKSV